MKKTRKKTIRWSIRCSARWLNTIERYRAQWEDWAKPSVAGLVRRAVSDFLKSPGEITLEAEKHPYLWQMRCEPEWLEKINGYLQRKKLDRRGITAADVVRVAVMRLICEDDDSSGGDSKVEGHESAKGSVDAVG